MQRWLKFVKYLPQFGWTPFVFTPENPTVPVVDESLLKDVPPEAEVIKFPIWEPYKIFSAIGGFLSKQKPEYRQPTFVPVNTRSLFQQISTWIRGNIFLPDPRVFWVRPSAGFLHDFIRDNKISTVITTGPPHSLHLIGFRLKKKNSSLKWIADFRDPWSEWGFLDSVKTSAVAKAIHRKLEKKVLCAADVISTITPFYVKQFERLSGRKVRLLTNGFDPDDFRDFRMVRPDGFVLRHIGIVNEKCDPRPFMLALREVCEEHAEIRECVTVEYVGEVHPSFREFVVSDAVLSQISKFTPTVPHNRLITLYGSSALLLLILTGYKDAEGYMPGKLFEYLATGLPILGIGPAHGDAAVLLNETRAGKMVEGQDVKGIKDELITYYNEWKNQGKSRNTDLARYSRNELTKELVKLME